MPPSLATTLASVTLPSCVYNASGPRTGSSQALSKIAASASGGVLAKSATLEEQTGNPLPRTWHHDAAASAASGGESQASLNSEGLPNSGIEYYIDPTTISESIGSTNKPYMVSISGHTLDDNLLMLQRIQAAAASGNSDIAAIELNLACPNVIGHPIIAYDFDQMDQVLQAVSKLNLTQPLGVKMPPYFDGPHFDNAARILNKYKSTVSYVACINTIGNALAIDPIAEMPAVRAKGGFSGLSGKAVKYTALANVRKMRELLDEEIDVVGVGGVSTGYDAFEMILCGATAVQVGTCHWNEGPKCFDRICQELKDIMEAKGYNTIQDFQGKLKEWSKEGASLSRAERKKQKQERDNLAKSPQQKVQEEIVGASSDVFFQRLCTVLMTAIAVLLYDKFGKCCDHDHDHEL